MDIQTAVLERPQRWELPELRKGRKAIEPGAIELSIETLHLKATQYAGNLDLDDFTVIFDSSEIRFYPRLKVLEVCGYN